MRLLLLAVALAGASADAQNILRVGPNRQFQTIQAAVDAASPWDRILVDLGRYEEPVTVTKGVFIDAGGSYVRGPITFSGIPPDQQAHLDRADLRSAYFFTHPILGPTWAKVTPALIDVQRCQGVVSVRETSFTSQGMRRNMKQVVWDNLPFVRAVDSRVVVAGSTFTVSHGRAAVSATRSTVTIASCGVLEGREPQLVWIGLPVPTGFPPPAVELDDAHLVLNNTDTRGGAGSIGYPRSSPAIRAAGQGTVVLAGQGTVQGGSAPNVAGAPIDGAPGVDHGGRLSVDRVTILAGTGSNGGISPPPVVGPAPILIPIPDLVGPATQVARGGQATFTGRARPGNVMFWAPAILLDLLPLPGAHGLLASASPIFVLPMVTPPGETISLTFQVPADPVLQGAVLYVQVAAASPTTPLAFSAVSPLVIR